jgi:hypothetical protein
MKDPLIFDEEQRDKLRLEMINRLQSFLPVPGCSLLTSTLLFVRCYAACQVFPVPFQHMASVIIKKFNETSTDRQYREQEAAFIALRQLNNSDLLHYLLDFAKRKKNLSDLLQFNSTIFHLQYKSFDSSNNILLSYMYLSELTFDAQILNMYTISTQKIKISPLTELRKLWNDSSKYEKFMTFHVASWITNYLHISSNKEELYQIIEDVSDCLMIERKALPLIEKWLIYRMDKDLKFFAYYAALQLIIEGSNIPDLIDVIREMVLIDSIFHMMIIFINRLFNSALVNSFVLSQILVILHQNVDYSSQISVWIDRRDTLELILSFELEQITSKIHQSPKTSTNSFLLMIKGCSKDLQVYLAEHLRVFINTHDQLKTTIKEEYVAIVLKWIIESFVSNETRENISMELYNYMFVLLHDQRFPQVQKAIINALNSVFIYPRVQRENIFIQDNTIINLETMICSWDRYSEDVIAVCLLSYGNCLIRLQRFQIILNVSDEMKIVLTNLSERSSLDVISIRAYFCLFFIKHSSVELNTVLNSFENKWNITPKEKYKLLLQEILYDETNMSNVKMKKEEKIVRHIEIHFFELIEMFLNDLYNYLSKKDKNNYLSDPKPNYIEIALKISEKKCKEFCNAIQKSSFGEEKFKSRLCLYYKNNRKNRRELIELYLSFGIVTVEFVDIFEWIDNNDINWNMSLVLKNLKQMFDRDVIETLFEKIYLKISDGKNINKCIDLLRFLVQKKCSICVRSAPKNLTPC